MIEAEFFDIFGIFVFLILLFCGSKIVKRGDKELRRYGYIVWVIGILGLIIDGYIVVTYYFL